jgi:hypothetical protein
VRFERSSLTVMMLLDMVLFKVLLSSLAAHSHLG